MSQGIKRLEAMRANPRADWRIEDIIVVCRAFGIDCNAPSNGSHYNVRHSTQREILTVPFKRPIKAVYVKQLVAFVDAVRKLG